jgi:NitT/TauT family transport system substrate-binding protein
MKIAVPDLISNSYFPAIAAVELGFFEAEGLDMTLEHIFPVDRTCEVMRDGGIDFVAGSAHSALAAFPEWQGAKLISALSQGMYWLLVLHKDLNVERGDINAVKGLRIGAAPFVELGLKRLLSEAGIDLIKDEVNIAPVPGAIQPGVSFGIMAAKALEEKKIDGFWANGMGAETAVRNGVGNVILDVRRGDAPTIAFNYTMPALITTDALIDRDPETVAAAVRAIVKTQNALKADVSRATEVGERLFPPGDATVIASVVERDLPYYTPEVSPEFVSGMNQFARDMGFLEGNPSYEQVVATQFMDLWN